MRMGFADTDVILYFTLTLYQMTYVGRSYQAGNIEQVRLAQLASEGTIFITISFSLYRKSN